MKKATASILLGILVIFCCNEASKADYALYKDPKQPLNRRINDLMKKMTLEEKLGQMVQIERSVASPQVMSKYFIGTNLFTYLLMKLLFLLFCRASLINVGLRERAQRGRQCPGPTGHSRGVGGHGQRAPEGFSVDSPRDSHDLWD